MTAADPRWCADCGNALVAGDRFCATCGAPAERACQRCRAPIEASDRFCPECGTPQEARALLAPAVNTVWDGVIRKLRIALGSEFRLIAELSRGTRALVLLADETALTRRVAIKVMAPGSLNGKEEVVRFQGEARVIANLVHPAIVTVYAVRQVDQLHMFVMQHVNGRSLAEILAVRNHLPLGAVRSIAYQVGGALSFAHRRRVIHRDVRPANVLVDVDGNAILTDFGFAKELAGSASASTRLPLSDPVYMSPEQCRHAPVSGQSDQYSLGVLLFECLAGTVPFTGGALEVAQGHLDRMPPSIRSLNPACPPEVESAVMRMLEKKPDQRFPSMEEALAALGAAPLARDEPLRDELRRLSRPTRPPAPLPAASDRQRTSPPDSTEPSRIDLAIPRNELEVGEEVRATATVRNSVGRELERDVTWNTSTPDVVRVSRDGVVRAVRAGSARVSAAVAGLTAERRITVKGPVVASIVISAPPTAVTAGETFALSAGALDARGEPLPAAAVTWSTSDSRIATVDDAGVVNAVAPGDVTLTVRSGAVSNRLSLRVRPSATGDRIQPPSQAVRVGTHERAPDRVPPAKAAEPAPIPSAERPEPRRRRQRIVPLLIGVLVIGAVSIAAWITASDAPVLGGSDKRSMEASLSAPALAAVERSGLELGEAVFADFESGANDEGAEVREGRLHPLPVGFSYRRPTWTIDSRDIAAHFDVRHESGDETQAGGLLFRAGGARDGASAAYFLSLRGGSRPGWNLLFNDGSGFKVVSLGVGAVGFKDGLNAVDLIIVRDTMSVFVNGTFSNSVPLTEAPGPGFGVFVDPRVRLSFDNLGVAALRK